MPITSFHNLYTDEYEKVASAASVKAVFLKKAKQQLIEYDDLPVLCR